MKTYARFIQTHRRLLAFGMGMTFFSSFGQTFLISLFVPRIQADLQLSATAFGSFYSLATLVSAGFLPWAGRLIDEVDLRRYALTVAGGLAAACLCMSVVRAPWQLFLCLIALRLTGQGLCGHTASTSLARAFKNERGKALSVSGTGYAIGEGILPTVVVALIASAGWRTTWLLQSACIGFVLVPGIIALLKKASPAALNANRGPRAEPVATHAPESKEWTRGAVVRDPRFLMLLPAILILPFAVTGLIIHQARLAEFKGWTIDVLAYAFIGFAMARIAASLAIGPVIDRFGAVRLFPYFPLPMGLGMALLLPLDTPVAAGLYLSLTGMSMGMAGSLTSSLWAELYGVRHLGAIKSLGGSLAVFGTALSPALFGWLLDRGATFAQILSGTIAALILACASAWMVCHRLPREA